MEHIPTQGYLLDGAISRTHLAAVNRTVLLRLWLNAVGRFGENIKNGMPQRRNARDDRKTAGPADDKLRRVDFQDVGHTSKDNYERRRHVL